MQLLATASLLTFTKSELLYVQKSFTMLQAIKVVLETLERDEILLFKIWLLKYSSVRQARYKLRAAVEFTSGRANLEVQLMTSV